MVFRCYWKEALAGLQQVLCGAVFAAVMLALLLI
jgi:hypothetical protein